MSALAGNEAAGAVRPPARPAGNLRLALRFALREMRGGLSGFIIFLACLTLGVASIAAVNSVSRMMTEAIEREGRIILGGDIRFSLPQRQANEEERAYLEALAQLPEPEVPSLESQALVMETLVAIDRLLDGLKPVVREAFLLSQLDGLTYPQIAERLGLSVSSIQQYMTQAFAHCYRVAYA